MDRLRAMQLFVRLADLGSFTRVAEEVGSSKSMVSKEITRLEKQLGTRLLNRSTRSLQLTHMGEGYLERCRQILLQVEDADGFIQDMQSRPTGKLRVNAPMGLGMTDLSRAFSAFMQTYPEIELDIQLSDDWVDLIEHGFDLGLRAASRPFDSSYIGKPIMRYAFRVCTSPAYLENHAPIKTPEDLTGHNCFVYSYFRGRNEWPLGEGVHIQGNLRVNSTMFMKQFVLDGQGIGFIPDFICRDDLASGALVEVLEGVSRPGLDLYAIYPARQFVPPKITHCIRFLKEWFSGASVGAIR